jgi:hypothetical protein
MPRLSSAMRAGRPIPGELLDDGAAQLRICRVRLHRRADQRLHQIRQIVICRGPHAARDHGRHRFGVAHRNRADQRTLVGKILIERADADARHFRHAVGIDGLKSVLGQNASRRVRNGGHRRLGASLIRRFLGSAEVTCG